MKKKLKPGLYYDAIEDEILLLRIFSGVACTAWLWDYKTNVLYEELSMEELFSLPHVFWIGEL